MREADVEGGGEGERGERAGGQVKGEWCLYIVCGSMKRKGMGGNVKVRRTGERRKIDRGPELWNRGTGGEIDLACW